MADGYPYTYFKTVAQNFGATVYDTDDLSTIRGSSLTLLAMPEALYTHLQATFGGLHFEKLTHSASELVFRVHEAGEARVSLEVVKIKPPKGVRNAKWNTALQLAVFEDASDGSLRGAARSILSEFNLHDSHLDDVAGQIWTKYGKDFRDKQAQNALGCISDAEKNNILQAIKKFQSAEQNRLPFDLFTFSAAAYAPPKPEAKISQILAALATQLGRAQLQSLTCLAPPPAAARGRVSDKVVCGFTGIFAAGEDTEKGKPISPQAARRRKVGREGKSGFYSQVLSMAGADAERLQNKGLCEKAKLAVERALGEIRDALEVLRHNIDDFANDFEDIVNDPPEGLPVSLRSNICVLNMDGNRFGNLRGEQKEFAKLNTLSLYLDVLKAGMLAELLLWLPDKAMNGQTARFETLLWGGDEFTFVAPSWVGWKMVTVLHKAIDSWVAPFDGKPLHFGIGVAFGPHNTPIQDLTGAAMALCELAKHDRTRSLTQTIAFEGIDRTQLSPSAFRRFWLGKDAPPKAFSFDTKAWALLPDRAENVLLGVGRGALHKWHMEFKPLFSEKGNLDKAQVEAWEDDIKRIGHFHGEGGLEALGIAPDTAYPALRYAQMSLMLDYILPEAGV